jgi:hypothetical protein
LKQHEVAFGQFLFLIYFNYLDPAPDPRGKLKTDPYPETVVKLKVKEGKTKAKLYVRLKYRVGKQPLDVEFPVKHVKPLYHLQGDPVRGIHLQSGVPVCQDTRLAAKVGRTAEK